MLEPSICNTPPAANVLRRLGRCMVKGYVAPGFAPVLDEFVRNFAERDELGASLCIHHRGEVVVDVWGGFTDETMKVPWRADTLVTVFSCSKAATALCVHHLVARGRLELDAPVASLWPEYAKNGKERTTARMMLAHTAGVPVLKQPVKADAMEDFGYILGRLQESEPFWPPGECQAYHPLTFGYLLGQLVRRAGGQSIGGYLREELLRDQRVDFWIGLPEGQESRVAPITPHRGATGSAAFQRELFTPGTIPNLFVFNSGSWSHEGVNTRRGHAVEIPAANAITNARGLAGLYAVAEQQRLPASLFAEGAEHTLREAPARMDATLHTPTRFHEGFMLRMDNPEGYDSMRIGETAFGHCGMGGSIGFVDPARQLRFGYAMNRLGPGVLLNPRGQSLVDACYRCINDLAGQRTSETPENNRPEEVDL